LRKIILSVYSHKSCWFGWFNEVLLDLKIEVNNLDATSFSDKFFYKAILALPY